MKKQKLKCDLCEGLIVNGRCMECGMFYQRNRGTYYLNKQRSLKDTNKDIYAPKSYEASADDTYKKKADSSDTKRQQEHKSDVIKKERKKTAYGQWNHTAKTYSQKTTAKTKSGKPKSKAGIAVSILFILIAMVADNWEDMDFSSINEMIAVEPESGNTAVEDAESDIYEFVMEEMPTEGEEYEAAYTNGNYIVGQHIPKGIYTASMPAEPQIAVSGSRISVTDDENFIYKSWWFDEVEEQDGYYTIEDIQLYEGAKIEIVTYGEITLYSSNAQIEELQVPMANTVTEPIVLKGQEIVVGDDMEPGIYDAVVTSGDADLTIVSTDGYQRWYYLCMGEEYQCPKFCNILLEEGDIVKIENYGTEEEYVILNPSPEIFE